MSAAGPRYGGLGVVGLGASGSPSRTRKRPDLCAEEGHPGVTFNPWMGKTWCLCGEVVRDGDCATHAACCGGPLEERADHCGDGCPFSGCPTCRYQGGVDPQAGAPDVTNQLVLWDNWDGKDGRTSAPTDALPEPPRFDLTEQEGLPTW